MSQCRRNAKNISDNLEQDIIGFGAFSDGTVVGYLTIGKSLFGSRKQYVQLVEFEVSKNFRGKKIGKELFKLGCS